MSGINGHRGQQRVQFLFAILINKIFRPGIEFVQTQHPDSVLNHRGTNLVIPALVLFFDKLVSLAIDQFPLFGQVEPFGAGLVEAIFQLLYQPGDANFEKLVQVTGANREEFEALEQWIIVIFGFFQNAPVEREPGSFAIDVVSGIV